MEEGGGRVGWIFLVLCALCVVSVCVCVCVCVCVEGGGLHGYF